MPRKNPKVYKRKAHKCLTCKKEFYKQGNAKYCSEDCMLDYHVQRTRKVTTDSGVCWIWQGGTWNNQPKLDTEKNGKAHRIPVRRTLYARRMGIQLHEFDQQFVHITCGTCNCVNPAHMALGPIVEGESVAAVNPVKLNWEKARQIRTLAATMTPAQLGNEFGVTVDTVYKLLRNEIWKEACAPGTS